MIFLKKIRDFVRSAKAPEKNAREAYDLWASDYDHQPQNLMLRLDNELFQELSEEIEFQNRIIVDIGCGTGRHWENILKKSPAQLVGYDVSDGMLTELKKKFPDAEAQLVTDDHLSGIADE